MNAQCVVDHSHVFISFSNGKSNEKEIVEKNPPNRSKSFNKNRDFDQLCNLISTPTSRRMMPLVPDESTTQGLSFEPPLACAEGR